ncbi:MAG: arginyltransferase [Tepidisphaeraceae bacterium]
MPESRAQQYSHYPAWPAPTPTRLVVLPEHECQYLPWRAAMFRGFVAEPMTGELYHQFMDAGFRRSGRFVYQPLCKGCRACVPIRVPVEQFRASRSQRRCLARNDDLQISIAAPAPCEESFAVYQRYMTHWHGQAHLPTPDEFASFLFDSPVPSLEFRYRNPAGELLAVGICDLCPRALSSVYFFFDPAHARRGLGTFGALAEIDHAKRLGLTHYYLGYWVGQCPSMSYKARFRPCQFLRTDGEWRDSDDF